MGAYITIKGRLGRDASLKEVAGKKLLEMAVAVDAGYKDNKTTMWFNCSLWGNRAEALKQYLTKGKEVLIAGELATKEYLAKDGTNKVSLNIQASSVEFCSSAKTDSADSAGTDSGSVNNDKGGEDDDLPF
jgi:single-strand DNA-binding protein